MIRGVHFLAGAVLLNNTGVSGCAVDISLGYCTRCKLPHLRCAFIPVICECTFCYSAAIAGVTLCIWIFEPAYAPSPVGLALTAEGVRLLQCLLQLLAA